MFEELYALAILYANGFDTGKRFQDVMNEMTLQGKEGILELQYMPLKGAVIHTMFMADHGTAYDLDVFGAYLMRYLREKWHGETLAFLGKHLYELWKQLPESLQYELPFELFLYADDEADFYSRTWITEAQCRFWFEEVFNYYENGKKLTVGMNLSSQFHFVQKPATPLSKKRAAPKRRWFRKRKPKP